MKAFSSFKRVVVNCAVIYLLFCMALYFMQKRMLFPTYAAAPVAKNWQPAGENSKQAFVDGSCGKLHMAIWRRPQAKGTVMMFHGNGESLSSISHDASVFHQLGYNLMSWDYPGYGRSTDCWFNQEMLLSDAKTAYQWLATQEDSKKIHLFGYSIGTGIALSVAADHSHNPIYLVAAYDALSHIAKQQFSAFLPIDLLFKYPMQTKRWINNIQQPIYLIHGLNDRIIPPANALNLVKESKGKAKIEWVAHAGHANKTLFEYRNQWLKQLLP